MTGSGARLRLPNTMLRCNEVVRLAARLSSSRTRGPVTLVPAP
jgi:hypothetical protein